MSKKGKFKAPKKVAAEKPVGAEQSKPLGLELAKEDDGYPDHMVESAADTLMRAETHKKDGKLMAKVHKHLDGKGHAIKCIQDLKDRQNEIALAKSKKGE